MEKIPESYPKAYIDKKLTFYGREFYIDEWAYVSNKETEQLITEVKKYVLKSFMKHNNKLTIVDVWTWCGNIGITLTKELGDILNSIYWVDVRKPAIKVAMENKRFV